MKAAHAASGFGRAIGEEIRQRLTRLGGGHPVQIEVGADRVLPAPQLAQQAVLQAVTGEEKLIADFRAGFQLGGLVVRSAAVLSPHLRFVLDGWRAAGGHACGRERLRSWGRRFTPYAVPEQRAVCSRPSPSWASSPGSCATTAAVSVRAGHAMNAKLQ